MTTYQRIRAALYSVLPLLTFYGVASEQETALWAAAGLAVINAVLAIFNIDTGEPLDPNGGVDF